MITLDVKMRAYFFDRAAVKKAADRGTRRALSKIGAFVRTRAKSRLRRRKRISAPGESPSIHISGDGLKKILFAYDPSRKSVVIGPVRFGGGSPTVPQLLEFGGVTAILEASPHTSGPTWIPIGTRRPRWAKRTRTRRASYKPRPFMQPAFAAELAAGTIPKAFTGVIVS